MVHSSCFFVFIFWFHIKLGAAPGAALALLAATLLQLQKKAFGLRKWRKWCKWFFAKKLLCKMRFPARGWDIYIYNIIYSYIFFLLRPYNRYTCICVTEADARTLEQRQRSPHRKQLYRTYSLYKQDVRCAVTTNSPLTLRSFLSHVHWNMSSYLDNIWWNMWNLHQFPSGSPFQSFDQKRLNRLHSPHRDPWPWSWSCVPSAGGKCGHGWHSRPRCSLRCRGHCVGNVTGTDESWRILWRQKANAFKIFFF